MRMENINSATWHWTADWFHHSGSLPSNGYFCALGTHTHTPNYNYLVRLLITRIWMDFSKLATQAETWDCFWKTKFHWLCANWMAIILGMGLWKMTICCFSQWGNRWNGLRFRLGNFCKFMAVTWLYIMQWLPMHAGIPAQVKCKASTFQCDQNDFTRSVQPNCDSNLISYHVSVLCCAVKLKFKFPGAELNSCSVL